MFLPSTQWCSYTSCLPLSCSYRQLSDVATPVVCLCHVLTINSVMLLHQLSASVMFLPSTQWCCYTSCLPLSCSYRQLSDVATPIVCLCHVLTINSVMLLHQLFASVMFLPSTQWCCYTSCLPLSCSYRQLSDVATPVVCLCRVLTVNSVMLLHQLSASVVFLPSTQWCCYTSCLPPSCSYRQLGDVSTPIVRLCHALSVNSVMLLHQLSASVMFLPSTQWCCCTSCLPLSCSYRHLSDVATPVVCLCHVLTVNSVMLLHQLSASIMFLPSTQWCCYTSCLPLSCSYRQLSDVATPVVCLFHVLTVNSVMLLHQLSASIILSPSTQWCCYTSCLPLSCSYRQLSDVATPVVCLCHVLTVNSVMLLHQLSASVMFLPSTQWCFYTSCLPLSLSYRQLSDVATPVVCLCHVLTVNSVMLLHQLSAFVMFLPSTQWCCYTSCLPLSCSYRQLSYVATPVVCLCRVHTVHSVMLLQQLSRVSATSLTPRHFPVIFDLIDQCRAYSTLPGNVYT